jgi:hypothetical protein
MFSGKPRRKREKLRRAREEARAIAENAPRFDEEQLEEIAKLEHFLKTTFPRDLLMPVTHGTKKPVFRHRGGTWSWDEWKYCISTDAACILLRDLVVIDVDDDKLSNELETSYPILLSVPCAETKRGRHYYFQRTVACNEEGFFDGKAQVVQGVDFKSVADTGTSGIVLVSPSVDKTWLLAPWNAVLVPIPIALLHAVAVPIHPTVDIRINFNVEEGDGTEAILFKKNKWIRKMPFFDALVTGEFPAVSSMSSDVALSSAASSASSVSSLSISAAVVPKMPEATVSWTSRDFKELLHFLDYGELNCLPTDDAKKNLEEFANFLLLAQRVPHKMAPLRNPALGRVSFQTDLLSISKRMCELDIEFVNLWRNSGSLTETLISINSDLANKVNYVPLEKDNRWLFETLPTIVDDTLTDGEQRKGVKVFNRDPVASLLASLPPNLITALTKYHNCLVLAGGSVVGGVGKFVSPGDDFDLFVYGLNREQANALSDDIEVMFRATHDVVEISSRAISLIPKEEPSDKSKPWFPRSASRPIDKKIVQVILKLYADRSEVIGSFDIAPCKALARCTAEGELIIEGLPIFVECMRHMTFYTDPWSRWAPSSVPRIFKYMAKGFECVIPGLHREAFIEMPKKRKMELGDATLRGLLDAEGEAMRARRNNLPKSGPKGVGFVMRSFWHQHDRGDRISMKEAGGVADRCGFKSEYTTILKIKGAMLSTGRAIFQARSRVGRAASEAKIRADAAMTWISLRFSSLFFAHARVDAVPVVALNESSTDADIPTGKVVTTAKDMRLWIPYDRLQEQVISDACCEELYDKAKLIKLEQKQKEEGSSARLPKVEIEEEEEKEEDSEDEEKKDMNEEEEDGDDEDDY